jgi:hypothetical protein
MMDFAGADKFPHIWQEGQEIETRLIFFPLSSGVVEALFKGRACGQ